MQASEIRKRAIKIRKVRRLHRFAGIYFFVLLIIVAATGLLLAWKKDAPGVLSIPTQQGISASPENWLTVEILYDIASDFVRDHFNEIKYPQFERIELRPEKGVIKFILEEKYFEVQLDASTGKVLSTGIRTSDIIENIHDGTILDHLAGWDRNYGKLIISTLSGIVTLFFAVTGVWLWWQRRVIRKGLRN